MFDWTLITVMSQDRQKELEREYRRQERLIGASIIMRPTLLGQMLQRLAAMWSRRHAHNAPSLKPSPSYK